ncbi:hypothetical protein BN1012_Phect862 [Candidatus Phaeomarinobacter ectocarpi]|uniref:Uncharacterized protein n=2 Tax=Candidatus Phaeomarinibacter ectocarpi TaxID=1458461 RepID=X5MMA1_9HYPH|nr:hypothetical protein BN1012_Phect862 [Candidatus Phaeomarinobacter ectocarpi]
MALDPELVDELLPTVLANNGNASAVAETVLAADSGDATVLALAEALEGAGYTDVEAIILAAAQEVGTTINTAAIPSGPGRQSDINQFSSSDPPTPSGS